MSDVIIAALGENMNMNGEGASRATPNLPEPQLQLLEALVATGKPIVLVVFTGRPLELTWADQHVPAILNAWFPGVEAGNAIADVLFGPAYKGIPLGVVTAIAYSELYGKEVRYCSDRKEEKDHGADKGSFLGSKLKDGDRVIMIEDVTTSGKSMEETVPKVKGAADVTIVGLMVSLNRMEVGKGGEKCALDEVKDLYGFETAAIVTMEDVVECLYNKECDGKVVIDDELKAAIDAYYEKYGAK